MSKLSKWLPFKFKRERKKSEGEARASSGLPVQAGVAAASSFPSPLQHFQQMNRFVDHMLSDRFWSNPFALFGEMDRFFGDFAPRAFQPSIDIVDEGKHVKVSAELPGLDRDDIDLSVQDGVLLLRGEKRTEDESKEEGCYRLERYFGRFERAIPLPQDVDTARAEAHFDKGVLTVRFPKTAEVENPRRIPLS